MSENIINIDTDDNSLHWDRMQKFMDKLDFIDEYSKSEFIEMNEFESDFTIHALGDKVALVEWGNGNQCWLPYSETRLGGGDEVWISTFIYNKEFKS